MDSDNIMDDDSGIIKRDDQPKPVMSMESFREISDSPSKAMECYDALYHGAKLSTLLQEAEEKKKKKENKNEEEENISEPMTLKELKIDFIKRCLTQGRVISPKTFVTYIGELKFSRVFLESNGMSDDIPAGTFNYKMLEDFSLYLHSCKNHRDKKRKLSGKRIHNILGRHLSLLRYGITRGYISFSVKNTPLSFKNVKYNKSPRQTYSTDQLCEFVNAVSTNVFQGKRDLALFALFISTGIRLGEALEIKLNDIDFHNRKLLVHGKMGKDRIVSFDKYASEIQSKYVEERKKFILLRGTEDNGFLFFSVKGKSAGKMMSERTIERCFEKYGKKTKYAGQEKYIPHRMRHTFATTYLLCGGNAHDLQILLGHEDIKTTMEYTHLARFNPGTFNRVSIFDPGVADESKEKREWINAMRELNNLIRKKFGLPAINFDDGLDGSPVSG